jgi:hypothetical protein
MTKRYPSIAFIPITGLGSRSLTAIEGTLTRTCWTPACKKQHEAFAGRDELRYGEFTPQ